MERLVEETEETPEGARHTLTEEGRQLYLELLQHLEEEGEDWPVLGDSQLGQLLRHLVSQLHLLPTVLTHLFWPNFFHPTF